MDKRVADVVNWLSGEDFIYVTPPGIERHLAVRGRHGWNVHFEGKLRRRLSDETLAWWAVTGHWPTMLQAAQQGG